MQTIKIDINKITDEQVDLVADCLKRGRVIAYPTDTIYGLGCDAGNSSAVEKIKKIKGPAFAPPTPRLRWVSKASAGEGKRKKPFIILVGDFKMLQQYCVVDEEQMEYLKKTWPGPVTVILKSKRNLPDELTCGRDSLAVRLPASDFLVKIISKAGLPIVSTSLNKSGEPALNSVASLEKYFSELPDLAIDAGECKNAKPSRLVDLREVRNVKVIRE
ncbi:MAG: L-threonylcarbamoyladenylate synthase [Patescibacteria group bacterium]|nr:L-threonylcarbamoyladenylate synthase [Patescibacteria group bacterium]